MRFLVVGAHLLRDDVEPLALAIPLGDLYLSAVEIADDQPLGDRELLLRVADVRAKLLDAATFIAIRYGFALSTTDEALAKCGAHISRWRALLTAHRDHVEMTLKVAASTPHARPDRRDFTSGADYLRALHATTQASSTDPRFRAEVERVFAPLSIEHRWLHRDEKSLELAALVARTTLDSVRAAGELLREQFSSIPFLLSGPWPLEVFADDDQQ